MPNEHIRRVSEFFRDGADIDAGTSDGARNVTFTSTAGLTSTNVGGALDELKGLTAGATGDIATLTSGLAGATVDVLRLERRTFAYSLVATPLAGATTTNISLALIYPDGTAATPAVRAHIEVRRLNGSLHTGVAFTSGFGGANVAFIVGGNNAGTNGVALVGITAGHGTVSLTQVTGGDVVVYATPTVAGAGAGISGNLRHVVTTV